MEGSATVALTALGHVRVSNTRCTARYKDAENPAQGPKGIPIWCALPAGHEGPHRHVHGHHSSIMGREHLIEFKPLPDLCQKCGSRWPCKDAEAVISAFNGEES